MTASFLGEYTTFEIKLIYTLKQCNPRDLCGKSSTLNASAFLKEENKQKKSIN